MKLREFLIENSNLDKQEKEVKVGNRIPFGFKVKPISQKKLSQFRRSCNKTVKNVVITDELKFQSLVCIECILEPDFKEVEFLDELGVNLPEEALSKVMLVGEINELSNEIMRFSGFDDQKEYSDELEEAKN